jgi:hypothetical protein
VFAKIAMKTFLKLAMIFGCQLIQTKTIQKVDGRLVFLAKALGQLNNFSQDLPKSMTLKEKGNLSFLCDGGQLTKVTDQDEAEAPKGFIIVAHLLQKIIHLFKKFRAQHGSFIQNQDIEVFDALEKLVRLGSIAHLASTTILVFPAKIIVHLCLELVQRHVAIIAVKTKCAMKSPTANEVARDSRHGADLLLNIFTLVGLLDEINDEGFARAGRTCEQKGLPQESQVSSRLLLFRQRALSLVKVKDGRHSLGSELGHQV